MASVSLPCYSAGPNWSGACCCYGSPAKASVVTYIAIIGAETSSSIRSIAPAIAPGRSAARSISCGRRREDSERTRESRADASSLSGTSSVRPVTGEYAKTLLDFSDQVELLTLSHPKFRISRTAFPTRERVRRMRGFRDPKRQIGTKSIRVAVQVLMRCRTTRDAFRRPHLVILSSAMKVRHSIAQAYRKDVDLEQNFARPFYFSSAQANLLISCLAGPASLWPHILNW